jgi:rhodanese-related sulfurtransferase
MSTVAPATITVQELARRVSAGEKIELIDVRTPVEFREAHIDFARNVPLDQLDPTAVMRTRQRQSEPLYVICQKGGRGGMAVDKFQRAGFDNVINVEGGTTAALSTSLPIVRGKKAMSLERQVRIAAGSLVIIGIALAYFVHPYCIGLSAFVGAGLVFAGITDTCGMGIMLSKMPWNQVAADGAVCATK